MTLLMVFASITSLPCQVQDAVTNGVCRFAVALPELEGPVTLGIFSAQGNLVRLLYRDAPVDSIQAGLNGLLIGWDGKDDSGAAVSSGTYRARGLVHGPVAASVLPEQEGNGFCSFASNDYPSPLPTWNPFPRNSITVLSVRDALLEKRKILSISARVWDNVVIVDADGLPLVSIGLREGGDVTGIELRQGSESVQGSAKLTVKRRNGKNRIS